MASFINSCKSKKTQNIYKDLCQKAKNTIDKKTFFLQEFELLEMTSKKSSGLLTGYYEASLKGSRTKKYPYIYPIYGVPKDLVTVDLSSVYPKLKNYRLRGRLDGDRLVPYFARGERENLDANVICYTDSKIDLFFLEVQGSGRVSLLDGSTIYIGFENQNGHKYSSIGKYLIKKGEIKRKDISLQSIKAWLLNNPSRIDEVLNFNKSMVFFKESNHAATGSLGLVLTPNRSIAVDKNKIDLGTMLYLESEIDGEKVKRLVMAQDTGGAIKGDIRADIFLGFGDEAMQSAGRLKSKLKLYKLLPKKDDN